MAQSLTVHAAALANWPHAYRPEAPEPCPDCGFSNWLVGRITAECACCGTALPISNAAVRVRAMPLSAPIPSPLAA